MKLLAIIINLIIISYCNAQVIQGVVIDEKTNEPVAFANVVLLDMRDSTFVAGCATDTLGLFSLPQTDVDCLLKVSCIGYETQFVRPAGNMTVSLSADGKLLDEVTVKGHRPTYIMRGGTFISKIEGTVYSQLGDAIDVLKQLPFIHGTNENIQVLGKGAPLFYINGRKMRDKDELQEIKSDMIKEVRVEMNPGAKYPSGTRAVIHIKTNRPHNDGLAGSVTFNGNQADYFSHTEATNLNYRHGKLDVFFSGRYDFSKTKNEKSENYTFPYQGQTIYQGWDGNEKGRDKRARFSGGFNYTFSPEHSLGLQYVFNRSIKSEAWLPLDNFVRNGVQEELFHSDFYTGGNGHSHGLYLYYTNQFSKHWQLSVDATYRKNRSKSHSLETEDRGLTDNIVMTNTDGEGKVYAVKAAITNELPFGTITWGTENSYTESKNKYLIQNDSLAVLIPNNDSKARQKYLSAFVSYEGMFGPIGVEAGIRYERTIYDYFRDGIRQADDCKKYNSFLPSFSLSSQLGELALSLNYNIAISRPSYNMLINGIQYINSFVYMQGNPTLKNSYEHGISLLAAYKDWQFMFTYYYYSDYFLRTTSLFETLPVIVDKTQNHNKGQILAYLVYSPTISFWKPTATIGINGQHLNYNGRGYGNRPGFFLEWKNMLTLPSKTWITCNFSWHSSGTQDLFRSKSGWELNASIIKNWKRWRFQFGANDIFGTDKTRVTIYDGDIIRNHNAQSYTQGVYLNIRYNIKAYKSRYKGKTAGQSEIDRL